MSTIHSPRGKREKEQGEEGEKGRIALATLGVVLVTFVYAFTQSSYLDATPRGKTYSYLQLPPRLSFNASVSTTHRLHDEQQTKIAFQQQYSLKQLMPNFDLYSKTYQRGRTKTPSQSKRIAFFSQKSKMNGLQNLKRILVNEGDSSYLPQLQLLDKREQDMFKMRYGMTLHSQQLSFCIVIYSRDYGDAQEYQALLTSLFAQKYRNFKVVFVADAMHQEILMHLFQYIKLSNLQGRVRVVEYREREGYAKSVLHAMRSYCGEGEIGAVMKGNDQMISNYLLPLFNSVYLQSHPLVVYGNYLQYQPATNRFNFGTSSAYSEQQKRDSSYRQFTHFGPFFSFNLTLLPLLQDDYFKDAQGRFYKEEQLSFASLALQVLQLSCGRNSYIFEYLYLCEQGGEEERGEWVRQVHLQPLQCWVYQSL